ncbi:hypothetical protein [Streptomyces sp. NPDC048106]|uniref:hypothetical protein n=1 Tax=Streptomyces sp. NPDC048106 TaxID=3155750 RepID=UPI0034558CD0
MVTPTYYALLRQTKLSGSGGATYTTDTTYNYNGQVLQYTYQAAGQKMTQVTNTYEWGTQRLSNSRVDRQDVPGTDKSATHRPPLTTLTATLMATSVDGSAA